MTIKHLPEASEEMTALMALADIRSALGVGDKTMLSELAGIVRGVCEELDDVQGRLDDSEEFGSMCAELILHHTGESPSEPDDSVSITDLEQFMGNWKREFSELRGENAKLRSMLKELEWSGRDHLRNKRCRAHNLAGTEEE